MGDDEFKSAVLQRLDTIDSRTERLEDDIRGYVEHFDKRLDAVVARLDEQDGALDLLSEKVGRLGTSVRQSLDASEQALTAVTNRGRRVTRLEHPDE